MIVSSENERLEPLERLRTHALGRHLEPGAPDNGVEDEFAKIRVPPVRVEMAAGEPEAAPAVGAFHRPADCEIIRLVRRTGHDDGSQTPIVFPKANAIIILLLHRERFHAA